MGKISSVELIFEDHLRGKKNQSTLRIKNHIILINAKNDMIWHDK